MKKCFSILAAAAAVFGTIACNKEIPSGNHNEFPAESTSRTELTVGVETMKTRATGINPEDEVKVNNLQVFVFRGDALDAYGSIENSLSVTLSCTEGAREVYAVVNAPVLDMISTKTDLLAYRSNLADNSLENFVMIGSATADLPSEESISIAVDRLVSKIFLKEIRREFSSAALAELELFVEAAFLTNVAGDINFGLDGKPTNWYNKMNYADEVSELTYQSIHSTNPNNGSDLTSYTFYCYPNDTDDSTAGSWSPRRTRLVLKTRLGNDTYYYPVTLPVLENNKSYELILTLTRPGSDNPDNPVSFADCTFELTVNPWTVVTVTDGITI